MLSRKPLISCIPWFVAAIASAQAPVTTPTSQPSGPQTTVRVHDPCAIFANDAYYLFSTGRGISINRSDDLYHWTRIGSVFDAHPAWAAQEVPGSRGQWAPDISFFDGAYHLYYSVSTFGSRRSCIGLTINKTLDPASADYRWIDQGKVVETHRSDNYNAIDPNVVMDENGEPWLAFGSCWDGIRICRLDHRTGKPPADEPPPRRLVHRASGKLLEGPFIVRRDGWFYLFISFDACCKGASSTYKVMVGRSKRVDGPYLDMDGVPMLEGGGTLVLASYGDVRGPGHNGVMTDKFGRDLMVHHYYDAADRGISKLQVRRLVWADDGWPVVHEPLDKPVTGNGATSRAAWSAVGIWQYSINFGEERVIELKPDGTVQDGNTSTTWQSDGASRLTIASGADQVNCTVSDDGPSFVGRNGQGVVVRGRRADSE